MGKADDDHGMERDEACRLGVLALLHEALGLLKNQTHGIVWRAKAGPETEALVNALESGGQHTVLRKWDELRRRPDAAHRPAPDLVDLTVRRVVMCLTEALRRTGLGKGAARDRAAKAVQDVLPGTTFRSIKHWQSISPKEDPEFRRRRLEQRADDDRLITRAIEICGRDHDRLVKWFVGGVHFEDNPAMAFRIAREAGALPPPPERLPK